MASNKSALCRIASLAFSFVLIRTSSDAWHWHLYITDIRDPVRKYQSVQTPPPDGLTPDFLLPPP